MKRFACLLFLPLLLALPGCQTATAPASAGVESHAEITLKEGDVIKVSFPGAPNLDSAPQPIRRDGKITLPLMGEAVAAGLTPVQLQNEILAAIGSQLLSKEVQVTVVSSTFSVYLDGAVMRPGKIDTDHPITILDAIMEAGGFDYSKANTTAVRVIRHPRGATAYAYYTVNVQSMMDGADKQPFYLQPGDIVHVDQKFSWF
ncbi:MAG TPA: polysaccharide biosynthesis/export family protein [Opitutaceae bacterium]|jgi:polysaccharide export outer membrane protein|nr:polysaccharide biosynthesis/export family protein [Opitutaceae bacterium]